jgi:hypothetical protein
MTWKPILAAVLAIGTCSEPALAQRPDSLPVLETRVERLQSHIESVESIRAIKRLQYAYGHYVELGLWNDFADLFTADAATNYQQGAGRRRSASSSSGRWGKESWASLKAASTRTSCFSR